MFTLEVLRATPLHAEWRAARLKLQKEREGKETTFKRDEINIVSWCCKEIRWQCGEKHIKDATLDEIECVSFNLGDFGLVWAAEDPVYTSAGWHPNLSPWKSYLAMAPCPDTPRKAIDSIYRTSDIGSIWIGCKSGSLWFFFFKWSNIKYPGGICVLIFYQAIKKSWPVVLFNPSPHQPDFFCSSLWFVR